MNGKNKEDVGMLLMMNLIQKKKWLKRRRYDTMFYTWNVLTKVKYSFIRWVRLYV